VNVVCEGLTALGSARVNAYGFFEDLPDFGVSLTQQNAVVKLSKDPPSAVPEPGTTVLFATGLALVFVTAGRAKWR
jgi:hypothetical protein